MSHTRYAVYYVPAPGALATFGADWLGWDVVEGGPVAQAALPGLADITATPRKYGFHGTLKPPFRLAEGENVAALQAALEVFAAGHAPACCAGLELARLGGFLALIPRGDVAELATLAGACVTELDRFRAPATPQEITRRRSAGLTPEQDAHLLAWGYPYVLDQFRFHLTLSGKLDRVALEHWHAHLTSALPALPEPFCIDALTLVGERSDGAFEVVHRYALTG